MNTATLAKNLHRLRMLESAGRPHRCRHRSGWLLLDLTLAVVAITAVSLIAAETLRQRSQLRHHAQHRLAAAVACDNAVAALGDSNFESLRDDIERLRSASWAETLQWSIESFSDGDIEGMHVRCTAPIAGGGEVTRHLWRLDARETEDGEQAAGEDDP